MAALTVWLLWGFLAYRRERWLMGLPLVALAWVNLHAGFPLLFLLAGALAVGESVDRVLGRAPDGAPLAWSHIGLLALALLASLAALAVNPNSLALYAYPFQTAAIGAHRDFLFEWSTPDLSTFPGQVLIGFLLLVVLPTLVLGWRRMRTAHILWLVGLSIMSLVAIRFALFIGPIGGAIAAIHLSPVIATWPPMASLAAAARRMSQPPRPGLLADLNVALMLLVVACGVIFALARAAPSAQEEAIGEGMPVGAAAFLRDEPDARRLFNVYAWGGYLGRELPDALVYIDGRSDIYGDEPIRRFADAIELRTDPAALLDEAAIDHVVFWPDSTLGAWLDDQAGWERVYTDSLAAVWARRS
jgi:hypothetical protein